MGYSLPALRLNLSSSSTVMLSSVAIWSINAPVPPAQLPFIRSSIPPLKKIIFASSPPSSITQEASGSRSFTTCAVAKTSCTNGMCAASARPKPAEPDIAVLIPPSAVLSLTSRNNSAVFSRTCEKWRS